MTIKLCNSAYNDFDNIHQLLPLYQKYNKPKSTEKNFRLMFKQGNVVLFIYRLLCIKASKNGTTMFPK